MNYLRSQSLYSTDQNGKISVLTIAENNTQENDQKLKVQPNAVLRNPLLLKDILNSKTFRKILPQKRLILRVGEKKGEDIALWFGKFWTSQDN